MKHRRSVTCNVCGNSNEVDVIAGQKNPDVTCKCGAHIYGVGDIDVSRGVLIKSIQELGNGDFPLAIVLAAMAADCELTHLFFKWRRIDDGLSNSAPPDDEKLEAELRNYSVNQKLDKVAELLVGVTLDAYISSNSNTDLQKGITRAGVQDLLLGSFRDNVRESLFWPRNAILHSGRTNQNRADAVRCHLIANLILWVYQKMDHQRRLALEKSFTATP